MNKNSMITKTSRAIALALVAGLLLFATACKQIDGALDGLAAGGFPTDVDQGQVLFDDTGNIMVILNNLTFHYDARITEASYIGAFVFDRGADPYARCCVGSECPANEAASCVKGVGFSNDMGYAGDFYLDIHPPEAFNKFASSYTMPIYVSDKTGTAQNYQGEYNTFSSPVNAVGDREQFDLYLGIYFTNADAVNGGLRSLNQEKTLGDITLYTAIRPDIISPVIQIESRFFPESDNDPTGSWYPIPNLLTWTNHPGAEVFKDFRGKVVLNEISFNPDGTDGGANSPEIIEIYNNSGEPVDVRGWRISKKNSPNINFNITDGTQGLTTIPNGAYLVVYLFNSGSVTSFNDVTDPQYAVDLDFSDGRGAVRAIVSQGLTNSSDAVRLFSDAGVTLVDYVEWTAEATNVNCGVSSNLNVAQAVDADIWVRGDCIIDVDGSETGQSYTSIHRVPNGQDVNVPGDWARITDAGRTPGAANN